MRRERGHGTQRHSIHWKRFGHKIKDKIIRENEWAKTQRQRDARGHETQSALSPMGKALDIK